MDRLIVTSFIGSRKIRQPSKHQTHKGTAIVHVRNPVVLSALPLNTNNFRATAETILAGPSVDLSTYHPFYSLLFDCFVRSPSFVSEERRANLRYGSKTYVPLGAKRSVCLSDCPCCAALHINNGTHDTQLFTASIHYEHGGR